MKKKILIIEDNVLNMKLFNDLLQAHGYETLQNIGDPGLMELAKKNRPDLILMDIQLPHISGIELIKYFKADYDLRHIPILAITAFAMSDDEERIKESGCDGYMAKPIAISSFLDEVEKFLNSG